MIRGNIFVVSLFLFLVSCNDSLKQSVENKKIENQAATPTRIKGNKELVDFSELVPLIVIDSTSNNIYEKYGIEFSGNCYDCDLAKINITKKQLNFINVCDNKNNYCIENFNYTFSNGTLKIITNKNEFIITKIDEAPVYKLVIKCKEISQKNLRIATYFTQSKTLEKFNEHDCGDFEG